MSRQAGILRLLHLRETAEAKREELDLSRDRFESLKDPERKPRAVSSSQLFQTPEPLAREVIEISRPHGRILEPSAGLGRLYRAIRMTTDNNVMMVESSPSLCGELYRMTEYDSGASILQRDFLDCTAEEIGKFDTIVMNPPFKRGTDIKHIQHAISLLADDGTLVAICADGPRQRKAFEEYDYRPLRAGSFRESGTMVNTAMIVVET